MTQAARLNLVDAASAVLVAGKGGRGSEGAIAAHDDGSAERRAYL